MAVSARGFIADTMTMPIQMPRVTRVEVIDSTGRAFVAYYEPGIVVHMQDDGRTVKIFAGEVLNPLTEKGDDRG